MKKAEVFGLETGDIGKLVTIFNSNVGVEAAILFGSRAKGTFSPGSDIDIALKGETLTLNDILALGNEIEELNFPYKIDLVLYHRIENDNLISHIDRVGRVLFHR
jgi:predicted nucleotidyltransferase